jgi:flagellin-like protein
MRFDKIRGSRWGRCRRRRAVSDVVATLLMVAVVVSLGVVAFTFASTGLGTLTQSFTGLMSSQGNAVAEHFVVEQVAYTTTTLAIDGSATGCFGAATQSAPCAASTTAGTATLTTASTNDVFVVELATENAPTGPTRTVSTVTCTSSCPTGLTSFAKRSSNAIGTPKFYDAEVWWATATAAASSMVITVTLSGATAGDASILVFGVSGANTGSPWDPNVATLPAYAQSASGATTPTVSPATTNNAADMILGFSGILDPTTNAPPTETAGTGLTLITTQSDGGTAAGRSEAAAEYNVVSATQSSISVAFGTAVSATNGWIMIGDAIQAAATSTPGADVYVRNVGGIASTLVSVYVVDQSTGAFVAQFAISTTLNAATYVNIPHTTVTFTTVHGHTYSFTVTSNLGNSVIYSARAA